MVTVPGSMQTAMELVVNSATGASVAHNGQVCSTWGNFHFHTFDGDFFQLPYTCNYILATMCDSTQSEFNIQLKRQFVNELPTISSFTIKLEGTVITLLNGNLTVNEQVLIIPGYYNGVRIERSTSYIKISSKLGVTVFWDEENSFSIELSTKYRNQTCGLCGDFNGIQQNEFTKNGEQLSLLDFGEKWKMDAPTEMCQQMEQQNHDCKNETSICEELLANEAFDSCRNLLSTSVFVDACVKDLCQCNSSDPMCLCDTISEFSRQCAHAGGRPQNWRTKEFCGIQCELNKVHSECGSPCPDTCSNQEGSMLCADHCVDGCVCPEGTVFNDIEQTGCVPVDNCPCIHNGKTYQAGEFYTRTCQECVCSKGRWNCTNLDCPGTCSLLGGSHITTFDGKAYRFNGNCDYVLSKGDTSGNLAVLGHLAQCGQTETETCLTSVKLRMSTRTVTITSSGSVLINEDVTKLPVFSEQVTVFSPSTFFIIAHTSSLQIVIQLVPVMQVYLEASPEQKGKLRGLCGNFNDILADDFKAESGLIEGTAATFAFTWKTMTNCPDVSNNNQDPCSMSVEKERYAKEWCTKLVDPTGLFSQCHFEINPNSYKERCIYDACNCANSEECMCGAVSSYVFACASKGVMLDDWRDVMCGKFSNDCSGNREYSYNRSSCEQTCRSLSGYDHTCQVTYTTVDGCGCTEGTYLNDMDECVPSYSCPCYVDGEIIQPTQIISKDGTTCTCRDGNLHCIGHQQEITCTAPMVFLNCSNAGSGESGAECQKSCQNMDSNQCVSTQCKSGCVCPNGLFDDGKGGCVTEELCPCAHNGKFYQPGETLTSDCNNCTCRNRKFSCTTELCHRTCSIYGDSHYISFDGKRYSFNGNCEYTLSQDYCSNSPDGSFRIITENIPCGTTGTTCSKSIKIFLENTELLLSEEKIKVVHLDNGTEIPYKIHSVGIYLVIEAKNDLVVLWDKKTSLMVRLGPSFMGKVCGLCGNYDGNSNNDFMTRGGEEVVEPFEFGNSWSISTTCPKASSVLSSCDMRPHRQAWAIKQCSIIMSDVFSSCHSLVESIPYYDACVQDTCACDTGGDCECFCTAVAAYASACTKKGACILWRSPDVCPLFCDYYNSPEGCEWHYKPCGESCLKTCQNPSGVCFSQLPPLEGCYPQCPSDRPFFEETTMKCVPKEQCGCDVDGIYYNVGDTIPSNEKCTMTQQLKTTPEITSTTETKTSPVTKHVPPTTTKEITSSSSPITTAPTDCKTICHWSQWVNSNYPSYTPTGQEVESIASSWKSGIISCQKPEEIECRATEYKDISLSNLGQNVTCDVSVGLICNNVDQSHRQCFNYEIRVKCCGQTCTTTVPPTTTKETASITTTAVPVPPTTTEETVFTTTTTTVPPTTTEETASITTTTIPVPPTTTKETISTTTTTVPPTTTKETAHITTTVTVPPTTTKETVSTTTTTTVPPTTTEETASITTTTVPVPPTTTKETISTTTVPPTTTKETISTTTTTTAPTTSSTPSDCKEVCHWSEWVNSNYPSYTPTGQEVESIASSWKSGIISCQKPEEIECRATEYKDISLSNLGQNVTCDVSVGLICNNVDQSDRQCFNYEIRVKCCGQTCTTTVPPTTTKETATTTKETVSTTTTTTVPPTTTKETASVTTTAAPVPPTTTKETISTTTTTTVPPTTTEETASITTTTVPVPPSTTKETISTTTIPPTTTKETTSTRTTTTVPTTTPITISTTTTAPTTSSTPSDCRKVCHWSEWVNSNYPSYIPTGQEVESIASSWKLGIISCQKPEEIECRATEYKDISLSNLGQNVTCDVSVGLICNNVDQSDRQCFNYEIRVKCCGQTCTTTVPPTTTKETASITTTTTTVPPTTTKETASITTTAAPVPPTTTKETVSTTTTTTVPPTTTEETTSFTTTKIPVPPTTTEETISTTTVPPTTTKETASITTTAAPVPPTTTEETVSTTTTTTVPPTTTEETASITTNTVPVPPTTTKETISTTTVPPSTTKETASITTTAVPVPPTTTEETVFTTTTTTVPPTTTKETASITTTTVPVPPTTTKETISTTTVPPTTTKETISTTTTTTAPTTSSTPSDCRKVCHWSEWVNSNYPSYTPTGQEVESIASSWKSGIISCQKPEEIECRATEYKDISLSNLGQNVTCDVSVGLICNNVDQSDRQCFNYEIRVKCCGQTCTTTLPPTTTKETASITTTAAPEPPTTTKETVSTTTTTTVPPTTTKGTASITTTAAPVPPTTTKETVSTTTTTTVPPTTTKETASITTTAAPVPPTTTKETVSTTTITTVPPTTTEETTSFTTTKIPVPSTTTEETISTTTVPPTTTKETASITTTAAPVLPTTTEETVSTTTTTTVPPTTTEETASITTNTVPVPPTTTKETISTITVPPSTTKETASITTTAVPVPPTTTEETVFTTTTTTVPPTTTKETASITTTTVPVPPTTTKETISTTTVPPTTTKETISTTTTTTAPTTSSTPSDCRKVCHWSEWVNSNYPSYTPTGQEVESIASSWKSGIISCQKPEEIECRATEYKDISLSNLGQNVTCDVSVGLICNNVDQSDRQCFNYEIRVKCCGQTCTTTVPPTTTRETASITTTAAPEPPTTTEETVFTTTTTTVPPTTTKETASITTTAAPVPPTTTKETVSTTTTTTVPPTTTKETASITTTAAPVPPTTTTETISTTTTTTVPPSTTKETASITTTAVPVPPTTTKETVSTTTTTTVPPTTTKETASITTTAAPVPPTTTTETISTTTTTTVPPSTTKETASITTTTVPVPPTTTKETISTTTVPPTTTKETISTTTTTTAPTTSSTPSDCRKVCHWSEWVNSNYPSYTPTGQEVESIASSWKSGIISCQKPEEIECRATEYKDISLSNLGQNVTCDVSVGLICNNVDQSDRQCFNYEIRVKCCGQTCTTTVPPTTTRETASITTTAAPEPPTTTKETVSTTTTTTVLPTTTKETASITTTAAPVPPTTTTETISTTTTTTVPPTTTEETISTTTVSPSTTKETASITTTAAPVPPTTTEETVSTTTTTTVPPTTTEETTSITTTAAPVPPTTTKETISTTTTTVPPTTTKETASITTTAVPVPPTTTEETVFTTTTTTVPPTTTKETTSITTTAAPVPPTTTKETISTKTVPPTITKETISTRTTTTVPTTTPTAISTTTTAPTTSSTPSDCRKVCHCIHNNYNNCTSNNYKRNRLYYNNCSASTSNNHKRNYIHNNYNNCTSNNYRRNCFFYNYYSTSTSNNHKRNNIHNNCTSIYYKRNSLYYNNCSASTSNNYKRNSIHNNYNNCTSHNYKRNSLYYNNCSASTSNNYKRNSIHNNYNNCTSHNYKRNRVYYNNCSTSISNNHKRNSIHNNYNCTSNNHKRNNFNHISWSVMYNETDGAGWCFTAYCDAKCNVDKEAQPCPTTTIAPTTATSSTPPLIKPSSTTTPSTKTLPTTTSTKTLSTTTTTSVIPPKDCQYLDPPKKNGDTWTEKCYENTCIDGSINSKPVQCANAVPTKPVCVNGFPPEKVYDKTGCCYHYECLCKCNGWGDPHYVTFDGTYYTFQGNCTYVLVQEIIKKYNLSVHIKNYYCDTVHKLACPESLTIYYKSNKITLEQTRNPTINKVFVNDKQKIPTFSTEDFTITSTGIEMSVDIPAIKAKISFKGMNFAVNLPYSLFYNNTEGQCGKCDNNTANDCSLRNGEIESCEKTASNWTVNALPCAPPPPTTTVEKCEPAICEIIKSNVFEKCHEVLPPDNYFKACVYDECNMKNFSGCLSLENYARLCAEQSICVDWRSQTNGKCTYNCPAHKTYMPCGPKVERTCNSMYNDKYLQCDTQVCHDSFREGCFCPNGTTLFSTSADVCAKFCGCIGPDNEPKKPGDKWHKNCLQCECSEASMGEVCEPLLCPMAEPCNKPGYEIKIEDCCPNCGQTENCVLLKKNTFLQVNDCISVQSVEIASCSGSCDTSSVYSVVANTMIQHCSCCQDQRTISKQVEMRCPDNRQITYTYTYVEECGCHVTECKDKKQG
ncbi:mucin-2-like [Trichomycterus rosablanca]|uniref:mucin-2-like n=1 Tax=Trichomycterus rosablanca TaxID=2290929 RepID=UPI002F35D404